MQIFYTVRSGDTLYNIAMRWSLPLQSLIAANNIAAPYTIYPGQQLSVPPGLTTYVVRPGDSVYSISQGYGIPMSVIIDANGLEPPYIIEPGTVLTVPPGVPFYVVRPGDTLFNIAAKYNVTVDGRPRPDLIIKANNGLTPDIIPGMRLRIPYAPPVGEGPLAVLFTDGFANFISTDILAPTGTNTVKVDDAGRMSAIFWSPDRSKIAYVADTGVISIITVPTGNISKIDQIGFPAFVDWNPDNRRLVYSTGRVIRIYDVLSNTYVSIDRPGASYVQWFPNGVELLFEAKDGTGISQLYRSNADGSNQRQITNNQNGTLNEVRLSPNGNFVLFTSPGVSISEIYTLDLATGRIYKIPGGPEAKNYYPVWSPDSTQIAYSSTWFRNGKYYSQIRMSGVRGEGDTILAISSCYATPVTWSPDSTKIAYLSGCREDVPPVEVWSIDIRKPVPINVQSGYLFFNLDWSPIR